MTRTPITDAIQAAEHELIESAWSSSDCRHYGALSALWDVALALETAQQVGLSDKAIIEHTLDAIKRSAELHMVKGTDRGLEQWIDSTK